MDIWIAKLTYKKSDQNSMKTELKSMQIEELKGLPLKAMQQNDMQ